MDEPRYSESEFRERWLARKQRIDAAVGTSLLNDEAQRAAFLDAHVRLLPDGRIAVRRDDLDRLLSQWGHNAGVIFVEAVVRAVFDDRID